MLNLFKLRMSTPTKVTRDIPQAANIPGFGHYFTPGEWYTGMSAERRQAHLDLRSWLGSNHPVVMGQLASVHESMPQGTHWPLSTEQLLQWAEANPGLVKKFINDRIALEVKAAGVNKKK